MRKPLLTLALIAVSALVASPAFADDTPPSYELARARAEACIAIANVTASQPCHSVECQFAEATAHVQIEKAKSAKSSKPAAPAPPAKAPARGTATLSPDGRTLTDADGKVYQRMPSGTFAAVGSPVNAEAAKSSGGGCYTVNGQTYCPYRR